MQIQMQRCMRMHIYAYAQQRWWRRRGPGKHAALAPSTCAAQLDFAIKESSRLEFEIEVQLKWERNKVQVNKEG